MFKRLWLALVVLLACAVVTSSAAAGRDAQRQFKVTSTLAGKKILPHRIRWLAIPNIALSKVREVDFLIDGKTRWIEHNPPYTYGYDGNYLVTSWLTPGRHRFAVRASATDGRRATSSTVARVLPATPPPAALAGTWKRTVTKAQAKGSPAGTWRLVVDKVGWRFRDPVGTGDLVDVAYLAQGLLEARGGIATKNRSLQEGNNWCTEPFEPVRYHWSTEGDTLTLTLAGPKRCDGQSNIWAGRWTRVR